MTLRVRRVVTGHDANGRAVVRIDEVSKNTFSLRPGATAYNVWTTESFPVDNTGDGDEGLRKVGTTLGNGTVFRGVLTSEALPSRTARDDMPQSLTAPMPAIRALRRSCGCYARRMTPTNAWRAARPPRRC